MQPPHDGIKNPCTCGAPVVSVIDDESASVVIVGGGPHALAALAALQEGSLAFQQYDDGMYASRVGFNSLEKVGTGARAALPPTSKLICQQ